MKAPVREAYDLHNPACRKHFLKAIKQGKWKSLTWLKLVYTDTINRVCSKRE
jgi:hypothetical protein